MWYIWENMADVAIVGYGYVGRGIHRLFGKRVKAIFDPAPTDEAVAEARGLGYEGKFDDKAAVNKCELAVISVPTAMKPDGSCDVSLVEKSVEWLKTEYILIKSTVKPGTTAKLIKKTRKKIAFSPEYLGESRYFTPPWLYPDPREMKMHTFQIFGGSREVTNRMVDIFTAVMGPHVFYAQTDPTSAEIVKYIENSWGAMKVTFCNEWFDICKAHGVDYREVRELWALDPRVQKMHTAVFPDKRGFGGKCFPKDVAGIVKATQEAGYEPELMKTVLKRNKYFTGLNTDKK
jgi:UDPglucose 6-dehydrogenase